jgi:hypothetical protein
MPFVEDCVYSNINYDSKIGITEGMHKKLSFSIVGIIM